MSETITRAQPVSIRDGIITVRGRAIRGAQLGAVREAYRDHLYIRETAGPGWGSHNALLRTVPEDVATGDELWYGDWLATINDGGQT